jgi:glycosyltransferase involved in cell wall biosynthesis
MPGQTLGTKMATMSNPSISVVMATHLRPLLLRRALQSLREQSFQDFEIVVVADAWGPADAGVAAELLRPQDVYIKRRGPPGPATSRNVGLDQARGDWVVFLDDDDSFLPHHLQAVHEHARGDGPPVLFTDCLVVTEDRSQPALAPLSRQALTLTPQNVQALWVKNFIPNHALAYRRTVLEGVRFDPHLASLEDWDFLLAVCAQAMPAPFAGGGVVMHKDYVNPGNRRGTQESSSNSTVILDFLHIYRRWPAPGPELKAQRQALLAGVGLKLPLEWF